MKLLLSSLLVITILTVTYSQDCSFEVEVRHGDTTKTMESKEVGKGLNATIYKRGDQLYIMLSYNRDIGCLSKDSYVSLQTIDGTSKRFYHILNKDCGGSNIILFSEIDPLNALWLRIAPIEKFKLFYESESVEIESVIKNYFSTGVKCLE